MKVVYTAAAQNELCEIGEWLAAHYPLIASSVERRIREVVAHIARWPDSAPRSAGREGVRVVPLRTIPTRYSIG